MEQCLAAGILGGILGGKIEVEETKIAASAPAAFFFFGIVTEEFRKGNPEERCGGDIIWERWEVGEMVGLGGWRVLRMRHCLERKTL